MFRSIRARISATFFLVLIFIALTLGLSGFFLIKSQFEEFYKTELRYHSDHYAHDVENLIKENIKTFQTVTQGELFNANSQLLSDYLSRIRAGKTGFAILIDKKGRVFGHSDTGKSGDSVTDSDEFITKIKTGVKGFDRIQIFGKDSWVAYAPVGEIGWTVLVAVPNQEIVAASNKLLDLGFIIFSITIILGLFLSYMVSKSLADPITRIASTTRKIAQGHFSHKLEIKSKDEIGQLANSFNEMVDDLRAAQEMLIKSHNELENKVRQRTVKLSEMNEHLVSEIKERNFAEKEMVRINEKLERSNEELREFIYIASHDLQEPLRKIQTLGDRLKFRGIDGLGDHGADYLERMQKAAELMQHLINGLLTFSHVLSTEQHFTLTDLAKAAEDALSDFQASIEESGGTVEISGLDSIEADAFQIRQMLENLIDNALKFRRHDRSPVVKIRGEFLIDAASMAIPGIDKRELYYQITVEDNGIGFDEKYQDRIFGVFKRLHGRDEFQGTGIGLSICRKIVERHGGIIRAKSAPGKGTRIIVTLPVNPQTEAIIL